MPPFSPSIVTFFHLLGAVALTRATFGQGTGAIFLDNVRCTGTEPGLGNCQANNLGIHNCGHQEDAGVRCERAPERMYY